MFVISSFKCVAQSYSDYTAREDLAVNQSISLLQSKGIDTICVYKAYCVGCFVMLPPGADTSCRRQPYENDTYFLWKKNNVTWFTLKNYCFAYDTICVNTSSIWSFYSLEKNKIDSKKIRPAEVVVIEHGKKTTNYVMVDHDMHEDIITVISGVRKQLFLNEFEFEKLVDNSRNINYTYNWNTNAKKFQVLLDQFVHINAKLLKKIK